MIGYKLLKVEKLNQLKYQYEANIDDISYKFNFNFNF